MFGLFDTYHRGPVSDHFDGRRFFNPGVGPGPGGLDVLRWQLTSRRRAWPRHVDFPPGERPPARVEGTPLRAQYIGHSTVLLQTQGLNILTDPVFSQRTSPLPFIGPKRVHANGVALRDLPKIDAVLLSHNHYDHMDIASLRFLWKRDRPIIVTPLGNARILKRNISGIEAIELDWQQTAPLIPGVQVQCVPAQHWSSRTPFDRNKALWGGFVIDAPGGKIYFAGDSGDGPHFADIARDHGPFRLALLPIGAYEPRWFMRHHHMNPADAVRVHRLLGGPPTIALHYGTFRLSDEGYGEPVQDLATALATQQVAAEVFRVVQPGGVWAFDV